MIHYPSKLQQASSLAFTIPVIFPKEKKKRKEKKRKRRFNPNTTFHKYQVLQPGKY